MDEELDFRLCNVCNSNIHITDYFFHFITEHPGYIALNTLFMPETSIDQYFDTIYNLTVGYMLDNNLLDYSSLQNLCDSIGYHKPGISNIDNVIIEKSKTEIEKEDLCSICMDTLLEKEEVVELKICKHSFCKDCITTWFLENKVCPVCKQDAE